MQEEDIFNQMFEQGAQAKAFKKGKTYKALKSSNVPI